MNSNSKTFGIFAWSILVISLMVSFAAASTSASFSYENQSQTVSVSGYNVSNSDVTFPSTLSASLGGQNFGVFTIKNTTDNKLNITLTNLDSSNNYYMSTDSVNFNVTNGTNSNKSLVTLNYINSFCNYGDINDSNLGMEVYVTNDGQGDSTDWNALDTIKVEVTVSNDNSYDLNNMKLELGLINSGTNQNIASSKLDWISGDDNKASLDTISSGDSVTYTFEFKVDPKILSSSNLGSGTYYLALKAYQGSQNQVCIDYSPDFDNSLNFNSRNYASKIYLKSASSSDAVVVDQSSLPSLSQLSCGQQLTLNPTVYNIGSNGNSYSKKQILVAATNAKLGINQNITLYGDLNAGNNEQAPLSFTIPRNADEGNYPISVNVYYGYNDNNGGYAGTYKYVSEAYTALVSVKGSCVYATPETTQVQAQLQSGGKAGEPLVVQATVTNMGSKTVSYNFGLSGYTSWARLSSINPMNITLTPGQSKEITLNLSVDKDASGNKQFYLDTYSNGFLITQQPLSMTINPSFSLASITGNAIGGGSWLLWTFNILLIVAIVVVLIVVLRKRA